MRGLSNPSEMLRLIADIATIFSLTVHSTAIVYEFAIPTTQRWQQWSESSNRMTLHWWRCFTTEIQKILHWRKNNAKTLHRICQYLLIFRFHCGNPYWPHRGGLDSWKGNVNMTFDYPWLVRVYILQPSTCDSFRCQRADALSISSLGLHASSWVMPWFSLLLTRTKLSPRNLVGLIRS